MPDAIHKGLMRIHFKGPMKMQCDFSYDSTEIEARERAAGRKPHVPAEGAADPAKGNTPPPDQGRPGLQAGRGMQENIDGLPVECDWGCKRNSKGKTEQWRGYKLHLGTDDAGIPVAALISSASLHDSQAAIPLMQKAEALTFPHRFDIADAAYDAKALAEFSESRGRRAVIDPNKRNSRMPRELEPADRTRFRCRTVVERTNSELKDSFGARSVMVRGAAKVFTHLMFGVVLVAAKHLLAMLC